MRRKTKPRVVWLPNTNANSVGAAGVFRVTWQTFVVDNNGTLPGDDAVGEIPIVIDAQSDPLDPVSSLADVENSGYRLRRIVGKIFVFADQGNPDATPVIGVTAAIIVRRVDPATGISLAVTAGGIDGVSPADIEGCGDPWIWRRNWILFNNEPNALTTLGEGPSSNIEYGSVMDGPHVDAKTARIISSEERLFLDVSHVNLSGVNNSTSRINVFSDLRVLASMRTSTGNRRNASR